MGREDDYRRNLLIDGSTGRRLDPEKGPTGAVVRLQETSEKALEENLLEVVQCILANIRERHLPSAGLLMALARRLDAREDVQEEEYQSLAEVLWKEIQEEQGPGTRD